MAKKAENKAKEQTAVPVENTQKVTDTAQELPTTEVKTVKSENTDKKLDEILNNDIDSANEIPELEELFAQSSVEETPPEEQEPPKVLFYIRTVNAKTAIRSTPEFPMKDSNLIGTIDNVPDGRGRDRPG